MSTKSQEPDLFLEVLKSTSLIDLFWVESTVARAIDLYGKKGAKEAGKLLKQIQDEIATRKIKTK